MTPLFRSLASSDPAEIARAFSAEGWSDRQARLERYLSEQDRGERDVLVAEKDRFLGYVTILWTAHYLPFQESETPEIADLNVLPSCQRQGIGRALMVEAEARIAKSHTTVGLGVGLTAGYGQAQRLYVALGYRPDGCGLMHD